MLLKKGSKGEEVKKIQQKLGLVADGIFGSGTEQAVKTWQSKNGLINDGVIGVNTWDKMFPKVIGEPAPVVASSGSLKFESLRDYIPANVLAQIPDTITKFGINTPLRLAHFLSQCAHESGKFKVIEENLNYSADGLKKIFTKYFPGNLSESYARQPEKIASRVYGARMGNGDETTKEGYKFRGRGYIQLTGKDNYKSFGQSINEDIVSNPDLVASKYPLLSAAWFFQRCLTKCDVGATREAVTAVTKCVNGGTNGLDDRLEYFNQFYFLLK
jgi:putative chitinase